MSLRVLAKIADELNNEVLGTVVVGLIEDGELSPAEFGALVRTALVSGVVPAATAVPTVLSDLIGEAVDSVTTFVPASAVADVAPIIPETVPAPVLPESAAERAALTRTVYDSFTDFRRRSLGALSTATGLSTDAVLALIADNNDFRVSQGSSGTTFVSVRGI